MPHYENLYLTSDSEEWHVATHIKPSNNFSGDPDITLTWVKDESYKSHAINSDDFTRVINIGESCYLESLDRLAFHNGRIKLTSVKVNNNPAGVIDIKDNVVLQGTSIVSYKSITIEDSVVLGPNVTIMDSGGHPLISRGNEDEAARIKSEPVLIKSHSWIGMGSVVLKGVTIGAHAVIGACSIVREDIPDYAIAYGNPAKVVGYLSNR